MKTSSKSRNYQVVFSDTDLSFILGALAETLEEKRQPYTGPDCRRLARLHNRLDLVFGGTRSGLAYAVRRDGAVVVARKPDCVIAPPEGYAKARSSSHG